jgi:hypothetical protein
MITDRAWLTVQVASVAAPIRFPRFGRKESKSPICVSISPIRTLCLVRRGPRLGGTETRHRTGAVAPRK